MLAFIDQIVIPFLENLYGSVGYLGVLFAMTIESAMIPLPSELILPFAGFLVSDPTPRADHTSIRAHRAATASPDRSSSPALT